MSVALKVEGNTGAGSSRKRQRAASCPGAPERGAARTLQSQPSEVRAASLPYRGRRGGEGQVVSSASSELKNEIENILPGHLEQFR